LSAYKCTTGILAASLPGLDSVIAHVHVGQTHHAIAILGTMKN
jgi:hypothetical protein